MSAYLLSVIGVVLLASVLLAIAPSGRTSETVKAVMRLACVIAILAPIVQFFVGGEKSEAIFVESGIHTDEEFIQYCSERRVAEAEEQLSSVLEEEYGLAVEVDCLWHLEECSEGEYAGKEIRIEKIFVFVPKSCSAEWISAVEGFILKEYGCEGRVIFNEDSSAEG